MNNNRLNSLAIVLPRYGAQLGGGAETLVRELILKLIESRIARNHHFTLDYLAPDIRIEVWTTCAVDHRSWDNFYPAGVSSEDNILVRRFPVDERDLDVFIRSEMAIQSGRSLTIDEQLDWLSHSVNSAALYQHIHEHSSEFDAVLFAPYLFATSFWGSLICPERALLIPCLHNEQYAYLQVFKFLFRQVRGLIFNAEAEKQLAFDLYGQSELQSKSTVVGMGFDYSELNLSNSKVVTFPVEPESYLLYSGRKEEGKNLHLLLDWFEQAKKIFSDLKLILIGSGEITFRDRLPEGVIDLGFVTEVEKFKLMNGALALCQPSINESFSIVIMETWLAKTPVIVHSNCAVTREHVTKSGGGLYAANCEEFLGVLAFLLRNPRVRKNMGMAGSNYVSIEYSWAAVLNRFQNALTRAGIVQIQNTHYIDAP